jgi:hypothetical protein
MRVFIVHKPDGEITSVIHAEVVPPGFGSGQTPVPPSVGGDSSNDIITEIPAQGLATKEGLLDIHKNYRYDVKKAELTKVRTSTKKVKKAEPDGQDE